MDLESAKAERVALLGEVDERFLAIQSAVVVGVDRARVRRKPLAIAAEQRRHREAAAPSQQIPQRAVDVRRADAAEVAQHLLQVVEHALALVDPLADHQRRDVEHLPQMWQLAAESRRELADGSFTAGDADDEVRNARLRAALVDTVVLAIGAEVVDRVVVLEHFHALNAFGHALSPSFRPARAPGAR